MKKMIRFTLFILIITGVFVFSSGEKVAASTTQEVVVDFGWDAVEQEWYGLSQVEIYTLFTLKSNQDTYIIQNSVTFSYIGPSSITGINYTDYEFSHLAYSPSDQWIFLVLIEPNYGNSIQISIDKNGLILDDHGEDYLDGGDSYEFTITIEDYHDGLNGIEGINITTFDFEDNARDFYTWLIYENTGLGFFYELREIENRVYIYQLNGEGNTYFTNSYNFQIIYDTELYSKIVVEYISPTGTQVYESTENIIFFDQGSLEIDFNGTVIQADDGEVGYIYFEKIIPEEYTITFNTDGGSAVDPIIVTEGALLGETIWDPSVVTTKEGYTFDDWYKNAGLTIPVTESDTVTADITVYAGWIEDIVNYTVTFNTNGGSYIAPAVVQSGNQATQPTDPQKVGYIFDGWYEEMFFLTAYDFEEAVSDNITLYAKWSLAEELEPEDDAWDTFLDNLPWIILGFLFIAIILKK